MENNENHISLKEIREQYYKMRDFEISNLWQRSIFLFFSAYGFLVSSLLEQDSNHLVIHEICCVVALLGFVFSIIWIKMAKGSKAWYEVYEKKIIEIEKEESLNIPEDCRMGYCSPWQLDSNIFTCKAGKYSVSRLNIIIGRFLMYIWFVVLVCHYAMSIISFNSSVNCIPHIIIFTLLPALFLAIIITALCNCWAKSGALE